MKGIKEEVPVVYLGEYDINVNKYLTYAQIQQIVNSTENLGKTKDEKGNLLNSWSARQQNIDMLVLLLATDIGVEDLQKYPHTAFLQSGIIDVVKENIVNYNTVEEAFKYTESWDKTLVNVLGKVNDTLKLSNPKLAKELVKDGNK